MVRVETELHVETLTPREEPLKHFLGTSQDLYFNTLHKGEKEKLNPLGTLKSQKKNFSQVHTDL